MLRPGSESFKKWIVTPVPLIMKVYFWNWTNPHQVNDTTVKPSFVEMGPYAFRYEFKKSQRTG